MNPHLCRRLVHGQNVSLRASAFGYTASSLGSDKRLRLGDRLEIVPNNATLVISVQERIYGVRNGQVERALAVG